jgi:hypothetical protein
MPLYTVYHGFIRNLWRTYTISERVIVTVSERVVNLSYTISDRLINKQLFCFFYDKISLQNMISVIQMLNFI